ncbi:GNAT family N-acetyltransferase [Parabacteroides pacaensis]|uniref:GNAT family N-acetyltransferase n=1 Tax=Parabacteroides pacaensis TaxID=2086575 RepID=UPI000D0E9CB1|nr:GNAT family N-acetyltransferase [Parabacteroides pacaensis]
MNPYPELQTLRYRLGHIDCKDVSILQEIFDDDQTKQYLPELNDLVSSEEGIKIFLDSFDKYADCDEGFLWGIYLKSKLLGFIAVMDIPYKPTLFYALHSSYRSQGIMKEGVTQVMNYLSEFNKCSCILSEVYKDNIASIKLLGSLGFENTGFDEQKIFFSRIF